MNGKNIHDNHTHANNRHVNNRNLNNIQNLKFDVSLQIKVLDELLSNANVLITL